MYLLKIVVDEIIVNGILHYELQLNEPRRLPTFYILAGKTKSFRVFYYMNSSPHDPLRSETLIVVQTPYLSCLIETNAI